MKTTPQSPSPRKAAMNAPRAPISPRLRHLDRLAQIHGWDSLSLRYFGREHDGYLFTRGLVEVEVRSNDEGRIVRAVRTAPGEPSSDPHSGRFGAASDWLRAATTLPPLVTRFTRVHRRVDGRAQLVTHDRCQLCDGPISNNTVSRRPGDTDTWIHQHQEDWANNIHHATPAGGPVTANDQPGPWLIAGSLL